MKIPHFLSFCPLFITILLLGNGCSKSKTEQFLTKKAYLDQKMEQLNPPKYPNNSKQNRLENSNLVLHLENDYNKLPDWKRQPYETMETWLNRIEKLLTSKYDQIQELKGSYEKELQQENAIASQIQTVIKRNNHLKTLFDESLDNNSTTIEQESGFYTNVPTPHFSIHLVQKGETLYSIAMDYFGNKEKIQKIILWNQGWIRHPNELVAGLALVIFAEDANEKDPKIVENYLYSLQQSSTL